MLSIADQTTAAVGAPSSVRIGTVLSLAPLTISVQGASFQDVGVLGSYSPQVGDAVAVLGQSPTSGSDPTSWMALGSLTPRGQQMFLASLTSLTNITAALVPLLGTEISFTTSAPLTTVQAWYTADIESIGGTLTQAIVRPLLDGVVMNVQTLIVYDMPVTLRGRFSLGQQTLFTVGPGVHTIELAAIAGVANQIRLEPVTTSIMITVHG